MSTVKMRHATLPGQEAEVPASAVPHHRAAGWEVVEDAPTPPQPAKTTEAPESSGASSLDPVTPKRRRPTKEAD